MAPRVGNNRQHRQYELLGDLYRRCCLAMQEATWGIAPAVAPEVGASTRLVQFWGEPQQRAHRQPVWDVLLTMRAALPLRGEEAALAPLRFLAAELGLGLTAFPDDSGPGAAIERRLLSCHRTLGELDREFLEATEDGEIDRAERDRLRRLAEMTLESVMQLAADLAGATETPTPDPERSATTSRRGGAR